VRALRQEDYDRITDLVWDPEAPRRDAACVFVSGFWADLIFRQTRTDLVVPILTPTRWFLVVFLPALFENLSEAWLLVLLERILISRYVCKQDLICLQTNSTQRPLTVGSTVAADASFGLARALLDFSRKNLGETLNYVET